MTAVTASADELPPGADAAPPTRLYSSDEVIAGERRYLRERRDAHRREPIAESLEAPDQPEGICLSGGGIRAATFSLGVLQALAPFLARFDYLSTVSGGGYIGCCLTSLLTRRETDPLDARKGSAGLGRGEFPFTDLDAEAPDREAATTRLGVRHQMHHLRAQGSYLASRRGLLSRDAQRALGAVAGALAYTLSMFVAGLVLAVAGLHLLVLALDPQLAMLRPAPLASLLALLRPAIGLRESGLLAVVAAAGAVWGYRWSLRARRVDDARAESAVVRGFGGWSLGLVVVATTAITWTVAWRFGRGFWPAGFWLPSAFALGVLLAVIARQAIGHRFSGPGDPSADRRRRSAEAAIVGAAVLGLLTAVLAPLLVVLIAALGHLPWKLVWAAVWLAVAQVLSRRLGTGPLAKGLRIGTRRLVSPFLSAAVFLFLLLCAAQVSAWLTDLYLANGGAVLPWTLAVSAAAGALLLALAFLVDGNRASLHDFYRDRLSEAYLQTAAQVKRPPVSAGVGEQGRPLELIRNDEDLALADLGARDGRQYGPYQLIVATLNLRGSDELERRGLLSDHFLFSRGFVGSTTTGFVPTASYRGGQTHVARAMAISGAAVSPLGGYHTHWAQSVLATLFSVRLGYWLENPWWEGGGERLRGTWARLRGGFWPWLLLQEMAGVTDARGPLVNVSDGGHTGDNLGLLPLLERRCRLILVVDGEADAGYGFGSFMNVVRLAEVELDCAISIDLEPKERAVACGKVSYPPRRTGQGAYLSAAEGVLVYVQAAVPGSAAEPGERFDETQFESYRALGHQAGLAAATHLAATP